MIVKLVELRGRVLITLSGLTWRFLFNFFIRLVIISRIMGRKGIRKGQDVDEDYVIYTENNRRRKTTKKSIAAGPWAVKENEIYLKFLQNNRGLFSTQFSRRSTKVFRKMSSLLRRRDPEQCRSHHQKLVIKCDGNIQKIIDRLNVKIAKAKERALAKENQMREMKKNQIAVRTGNRETVFVDQAGVSYDTLGDIKITIDLNFVQSW